MSEPVDFWAEMGRPGPHRVIHGGVELRRGSRVRLKPRRGGDILDLALAGRTAVLEGIEEDESGGIHLAVTIVDDPGRDLGDARMPGHRFFFALEDVEPLDGPAGSGAARRRVLIAGIGNVFLGDDGFGVAVARALAERPLPPNVDVVDFGIRGLDLAYALGDYDAAVLVDAVPRGGEPGSLYLIEPDEPDGSEVALDTHGMDPVKVLALARRLGDLPADLRVVGCEPGSVLEISSADDLSMTLSPPVRAAVSQAVELVESLVPMLLRMEEEDPDEGAETT